MSAPSTSIVTRPPTAGERTTFQPVFSCDAPEELPEVGVPEMEGDELIELRAALRDLGGGGEGDEDGQRGGGQQAELHSVLLRARSGPRGCTDLILLPSPEATRSPARRILSGGAGTLPRGEGTAGIRR